MLLTTSDMTDGTTPRLLTSEPDETPREIQPLITKTKQNNSEPPSTAAKKQESSQGDLASSRKESTEHKLSQSNSMVSEKSATNELLGGQGKRVVPRLNLFNDGGSDQFETPKSLPYDSQDLNSLQGKHDPGEDSDELMRVPNTPMQDTIPSANGDSPFINLQKGRGGLNHSFSGNSSNRSLQLHQKLITTQGSEKNGS